MVQPCIWFKEEASQFAMGQTAHSLTCSTMEKPQTGLDECPRILLSYLCLWMNYEVSDPDKSPVPSIAVKSWTSFWKYECEVVIDR